MAQGLVLFVQLAEMPLTFPSIIYTHVTIIITPELVRSNSLEDAFPIPSKTKQLKIEEFITMLWDFFFTYHY